MNFWLVKSEPSAFSIDDLRRRKREPWDGVRNYQARNFMRDAMHVDDKVFFYHSNCAQTGIVGLAKVASEPYPDPTQFDRRNVHFDPTSKRDDPRWVLVDMAFVRKFRRIITLDELKGRPELAGFALVRKGNRLSVMPVAQTAWDFILTLE